MKKIELNNIINKIFNEIKYNKKLIISWVRMFSSEGEEDIRKFLKSELQNLIDQIQKGDVKIGEVQTFQMFKAVKDTDTQDHSEEISDISQTKNEKLNIVTFSADKKIRTESIQINYFIDLDLKNFLLSTLWLETIGYILDSDLSDDIYANRLTDNKTSFFKPYYSAYSNFRDSNFKIMREWVDKNQTGVYIQTDFERCFYNINITTLEENVEKILKKDDIVFRIGGKELNKEQLQVLNASIFNIIKHYNNLFREGEYELNGEDIKCGKALPIGFLPSNILINFYLKEVDEQIKDEYHPVNYARYVDDIAFVVKTDFEENNVQQKISKISEKLKNIFSDETAQTIYEGVKLNANKTLYFVIGKKNDINYLNKFQKQTERLSSDSHRLLDPSEFEEEFEQAYTLTKDLTKLSDMFTIVRDKKYISRTISTLYRYIFSGLRLPLDKLHVEMAEKFIDYFYSFVDDEYFLSLVDYWYHLVTIELVSKKIDVEKVIEIKKLKSLKVWQKISELDEQHSSKGIKFIKNYQQLLEKLYQSNQESYCYTVQSIFRLPAYKLDNAIYNEKYLKNYEFQFRKLNDFIKTRQGTDSEKWDIIETFMVKINSRNNATDDDFVDYDFKKSICIAQANFYSYDDRESFFKQNAENRSNMSEVIETLNEADRLNADVLIYPEQGIVLEDLAMLARFSSKTKTLIIGGLDFIYHKDYIYNFAFVIVPRKRIVNDIEYQDCEIRIIPKIFPAPEEYEYFHNSKHPENGKNWEIFIPKETIIDVANKYRIFEFRHCKHALLNCYEATSIDLKYEVFKEHPLVVHLITNNKDIKYYYQIAESFSRDAMAATTITNYSKLGGVQVYSPYKKEYARQLSHHKGSKHPHVDICDLSIQDLIEKRRDNQNSDMKQNPPLYYYKNIGR